VPPLFRPASKVQTILEHRFPELKNTRWSQKSPWDDRYKCIAWAACRTDLIWWPVEGEPQIYWPPNAPLDDDVDAFIQAFSAIGYRPCDSREFEFGYQKVAIYASYDRRVLHMARQHLLGRGWLSKLGQMEDISHYNLKCLEGDPSPIEAALGSSYGRVTQILKRTWWAALVNLCLFRSLWASIKFWLYRLRHPSLILGNIVRNRSRNRQRRRQVFQ
jgi:hypothetical protein